MTASTPDVPRLPALPGGVGIIADRLAAISSSIVACSDILAEYDMLMALARERGLTIPAAILKTTRLNLRPIKTAVLLLRLRLQLALQAAGYGSGVDNEYP